MLDVYWFKGENLFSVLQEMWFVWGGLIDIHSADGVSCLTGKSPEQGSWSV